MIETAPPAEPLPTLLLAPSVSTETIGIGKDYQSRHPSYQIWVSFRPRYYFYESDTESFNVNGKKMVDAEDAYHKNCKDCHNQSFCLDCHTGGGINANLETENPTVNTAPSPC